MIKPNVSLRVRLMVAFALILLGTLAVPAYFLNQHLARSVEAEARDEVLRNLDAVDMVLAASSRLSLSEANEMLRRMASAMNVRITYIGLDGRVLTDSGVTQDRLATLENHASRPEVLAAAGGETGLNVRYSDTLDQFLMYAARRSSGHGVLPEGYLRVARPQSQIRSLQARLYGRTGWVYVASILVAFGLISLVSRQVSRSIGQVARAAAEIGQGGTGRRIRVSPSRELVPLVESFNNMLERIDLNVATITKQKMESEAILNGMKAGVIVLDGTGHILRGNYAAREIFPGLPAFAGRKPMEMVLLQTLQDACDTALAKRENGDITPVNLEVPLPGEKTFDVSVVPVKGDQELGAILVFHDITEIRRVEQIRRDFVANVSHELRTPLTSIKGYAETLLGVDIWDREQAGSFMEVILRNANHMNTMLDELLQLSRLEHGKQRVDFVSVDPYSVVYSAWKGCQPLARDVRFVNELKEGALRIRGNFEQLVQVFRNVFENAVKYVPEDTPMIRVYVRETERGLEFCVEDNGPGIPAEDQSRIFERFYRVEKDRNSAVEGTGLGLAICRHIMASHNGRISVQSPVPETGVGSRFIITVPLAGQVTEEYS